MVATARNTEGSSGLQDLKAQDQDGRLLLVDLDVTKPESITAAAKKTAELLPGGLDNLISNAGVSENALKSFEELYVKFTPSNNGLGPRELTSRHKGTRRSSRPS